MLGAAKLHSLAPGEYLVPSVLLIPPGQRGGHMHLLNDVPPSYTGIVSAKRDFPFLRSVRNNALLGPAKIVIEQVLEPHARHEQQVPAVAAAAENVLHCPLAGHISIV